MTILAPEVVSDIEALSEEQKVHWEKHLFRGDDLFLWFDSDSLWCEGSGRSGAAGIEGEPFPL